MTACTFNQRRRAPSGWSNDPTRTNSADVNSRAWTKVHRNTGCGVKKQRVDTSQRRPPPLIRLLRGLVTAIGVAWFAADRPLCRTPGHSSLSASPQERSRSLEGMTFLRIITRGQNIRLCFSWVHTGMLHIKPSLIVQLLCKLCA